MSKTIKGPFFVKNDTEYELTDFCKQCAFGDELGCLMNPCIYFEELTKAWNSKDPFKGADVDADKLG